MHKVYDKDKLKDLAEELGNLRYDSLAEFLGLLGEKLYLDGKKDQEKERPRLGGLLKWAANNLRIAEEIIQQAYHLAPRRKNGSK